MSELGNRLRHMPGDTLAALSFFSRLPARAPARSLDLHRSAGAWPIAGLIVAIVPALLLLLLRAADFPSFVAALLALAALMGLSGAIHADGLADTADGFGGGRTRQEKLEIMRDSRLGTYGALALAFTVLVAAAALAEISRFTPLHGALALLCAAVLSRSMALWHWNTTMPARHEGMAWAAGRPDWLALLIGLAVGAVAAVVLVIAFGLAALLGILLAAAGVGLFSTLSERQIGGHTGDTIGAAQQVGEALLLAGLSAGWLGVV